MSEINCGPYGVYNMLNQVLTVEGRRVFGFAEGDDVIDIEDRADLGDPVEGADGTALLSVSAVNAATVTIKLVWHSPWNKFFAAKAKRMKGGDVGKGIQFPISFLDTQTGENGNCTQATLMKRPNRQRGGKPGEMEWVIYCPCWQDSDVNYGE